MQSHGFRTLVGLRAGVASILAMLVLGLAPPPAQAQSVPAVEFLTVWRPPAGGPERVKRHKAFVNQPKLLDVDGDPALGLDNDAELVATLFLTYDTGGYDLKLQIDRQAGAVGKVPVWVEVIGELPTSPGTFTAFGYDAREGDAPLKFSAVPTIVSDQPDPPARRTLSLSLTVSQTPAPYNVGGSLALTGEVFRDAGERREEALRADVRFASPLPAQATLSANDVQEGGAQGQPLVTDRALAVRTNQPTVAQGKACILGAGASYAVAVSNTACDADRGAVTVVDATVDKLPAHAVESLAIRLRDDGSGRKTASYTASAEIDEVRLARTDRLDGSQLRQDEVRLFGLPTSGAIDLWESDDDNSRYRRMNVEAAQPIGAVEARILTRGQLPALPDTLASFDSYAYIIDDLDTEAVLARLEGVKQATFLLDRALSEGEPGQVLAFVFEAALKPGTLKILSTSETRELELTTSQLPHHVRIAGLPQAGAWEYSASEPVESLDLRAVDPEGIFDRATHVDVHVEGLPTKLGLAYPAELREDLRLWATDGPIGQLEFRAASSQADTESLPAGADGVLLRDLPERFLLHGRVTGLRKVEIDDWERTSEDGHTITKGKQFLLDATGRRRFEVDVAKEEPSLVPFLRNRREYLTATIDALQPETRVRLVQSEPVHGSLEDEADRKVLRVEYTAAGAADKLQFETNFGSRLRLQGDLAPLPSRVEFCKSPGRLCLEEGRETDAAVDKGSLLLDASDYTTVNLLDCKEADTAECGRPKDFLFIDELNIKHISYWLSRGGVTEQPKLYVNTATSSDPDLTVFEDKNAIGGGYVLSPDVELVLPEGLWARDRLVRFLRPDDLGEIYCPPGTYFEYDIDDVNWEPDVTDLVCS